MRTHYILKWLWLTLVTLPLCGCIHDGEPTPGDGRDEAGGIQLLLSTRAGDYTFADGSDAESHLDFSAIRIYAFDSKGNLVARLYNGGNTKYATLTELGNGSAWLNARFGSSMRPADGKLTLVVTQEPSSLFPAISAPADFNELGSIAFGYPSASQSWEPAADSRNCFPLYGMIDIDLSEVPLSPENNPAFTNVGTIWMLRAMAKIEITANDFAKLTDARLKGVADKGCLMPDISVYQGGNAEQNWKDKLFIPNLPSGARWLVGEKGFLKKDDRYVAYVSEMGEEMMTEIQRKLMEVTYEGKDYDLLFTSYLDNEPQATPAEGFRYIARNCVYTFNIVGIGEGELKINVKVRPWLRSNFYDEL